MFQRTPNAPAAQTVAAIPTGPADFLIGRIADQAHYSNYLETQTDHPISTGSVNAPREHGTADAVSEIPLSKILINPGMSVYADMTPLITTDGAPVSATGVGSWGQLYAAGRMG